MRERNLVLRHYSAPLPFPDNAVIYELEDGSIQITVPAPTEAVIANFQSAMLGSESDSRLRWFFARSLIQADRWNEAEKQVHEGLRYNPDDVDLHLLLAEICEHNGNLQAAVDEGRLAISHMNKCAGMVGTSSEAISLQFIAGIYAAAGLKTEALELLRRASDLFNTPGIRDHMSSSLVESVETDIKALSAEDA